jgi:hypothetical protein
VPKKKEPEKGTPEWFDWMEKKTAREKDKTRAKELIAELKAERVRRWPTVPLKKMFEDEDGPSEAKKEGH